MLRWQKEEEKGQDKWKGKKVMTCLCNGFTNRSEAWNDQSQYQQWNTREESLKRKYEEE